MHGTAGLQPGPKPLPLPFLNFVCLPHCHLPICRRSMRRFWSVVLPFTFASPLGIFVGFVISDIAKGVGAASISALASGACHMPHARCVAVPACPPRQPASSCQQRSPDVPPSPCPTRRVLPSEA